MNNSVQVQQVMTLAVEAMFLTGLMQVIGSIALGAASSLSAIGTSKILGED